MKKAKTALKILLFLVAGIVTLLALGLSWISHAGRQEWARTKAELLARGEKLSLVELAPPPVPDDQNFYADPMWWEVADLVETEAPGGGKQLVSRLSSSEQQVAGLNRRLTDAEWQSFETAFPEFAPLSRDEGNSTLSAAVWRKAAHGDIAKRRRAAEGVLTLLALSEPVLSRIEILARRPGARFAGGLHEVSVHGRLDYAMAVLQAGAMAAQRAKAKIALGDGAGAERDVLLTFRLAEILGSDPLLICFLIKVSADLRACDAIADGIRQHLWTGTALENFERVLSRENLLRDFATALRGERGMVNQFFQGIGTDESALASASARTYLDTIFNGAGPVEGALFAGFLRLYRFAFLAQDQALTNRLFQHWIDALQDGQPALNAQAFRLSEIERIENPVTRAGYLLSMLTFPVLQDTPMRVVKAESALRQIRMACALERYWRKNGEYPASLDQLVPDFLAELPPDPVTGGPMRYVRTEPGAFKLWSVGWDEKDDGGVPGKRKAERDWVWDAPAR